MKLSGLSFHVISLCVHICRSSIDGRIQWKNILFMQRLVALTETVLRNPRQYTEKSEDSVS